MVTAPLLLFQPSTCFRNCGPDPPPLPPSPSHPIYPLQVATMFKHKRRWDVLFAEYNKGEVSVEDAANKVGLALPHVSWPATCCHSVTS